MRDRFALTVALAVLFVAPLLASAAVGDEVCLTPPCVDGQPSAPPVNVQAKLISTFGGTVHAFGNVYFTNCTRRVFASELFYDVREARGWMKDVTFTTCNKDRPDYRFEAKQIKLLPNNRIQARGASLYLGQFKVITLPSIKMNIGQRGMDSDTFPRPGYDSNDGFAIQQKLRLSDTERLRVNADVRLTTKNGLEGELDNLWGIDGELITLPGRFLTYDSLRSSALTVPRYLPENPCAPRIIRAKKAASLTQFARFSLRQRTFDIRNSGLLVYRQPEVGVAYTAQGINLTSSRLDPRLELYPTATATWGEYKENPGTVGLTSRARLDCAIPVNVFPLGPRTAVQPVYMFSASSYGTGTNYRMAAYALDVTHMFPNGSIFTARYIKRNESGTSPFIFDTVDIFHEFQAGFQARLRNVIIGYTTGYNADTGTVYDWELLLGYHTDCVIGWFTYDRRWQRFMFNVALINL